MVGPAPRQQRARLCERPGLLLDELPLDSSDAFHFGKVEPRSRTEDRLQDPVVDRLQRPQLDAVPRGDQVDGAAQQRDPHRATIVDRCKSRLPPGLPRVASSALETSIGFAARLRSSRPLGT